LPRVRESRYRQKSRREIVKVSSTNKTPRIWKFAGFLVFLDPSVNTRTRIWRIAAGVLCPRS
jgi:hypothetical protein